MRYLIFLLLIFTSATQATELRIEAEPLSKLLDHYTVLDAREASVFKQGHIKGALNFPVSKTFDKKDINRIINPQQMQAIIRSLGIDVDSAIVIYGDSNLIATSRLFWVLEVYGFNDVKMLNASFDTWQNKKLAISYTAIKPKPSKYVATINHNLLATQFSMQVATQNPNHIIIDARATYRYQGLKSISQRYGHIPTAINIPASSNFILEDSINYFKPLNELKSLYANLSKDKKITVYCSTGMASSVVYFVLRELGYNVSNYDASWFEWGNDLYLPVTKLQVP